MKGRFPVYFSRRDELSTTPDGVLCLNDRVVIPHSLRKSILDDLHSGHFGVEKMKSLSRLTCWWAEINADICRTANNCEKCHQLKIHDQRLIALLRRLIEKNITVNPNSCSFCVSSFECLGYLVDGDGFRPDMKGRFPVYFSRRDELSTTPDGVLCLNDRVVIPHSLRKSILDDLHSGHFGVEKMKSLSRLTCWWAEINADICRTANNCEKCHQLKIHDQRLIALLRRLIEKNITVNPNSCSFCVSSFECLGYLVDGDGFRPDMKGRFPVYFSRRDELSTTPDGVLCLNDRVVIPHSLRKSILDDLHSGHFGVEKMKSLSRLTCWWAEINADICRTANNCEKCHQLKIHDQRLIALLRRLIEKNITVNPNSCSFCVSSFECLGYLVDGDGFRPDMKGRFPVYFSRRDELSTTPDGVLCLNDRVVIPHSLRKSILDDLHSGHFGVEKMKSLSRLTCWWAEINADICRTANNCEKCHQLKSQPSKWTPWPVWSEAWQRVHADYCGPFQRKYYEPVVIDSFSKWPDVLSPLHQL
ncbi:unnamed protein product [Schistosoma intercalatum]|nr:unnamed protein product [Schistosoma intercalatum]